MNQLEQAITTVEIAEMMETEHGKILRKLEGDSKQKGIIPTLTQAEIGASEYFQESTYKDVSGKENKCYLVTKLGCDFLANKFTGEKGILFTAKYVKKFAEMKEVIESNVLPMQDLSPELQMFNQLFVQLANNELANKQIKQEVQAVTDKVESIREVIALDTTSWRDDTRNLISKMSNALGGGQAFSQVRAESYEYLEKRMGVSVKTRLTNKRRRMADEGVCKSKRDKLSYIDIIAEDKKLIEGYTAIVKEMAIHYGVA